MADNLGLDLGQCMTAGVIFGLPISFVGMVFASLANRRMVVHPDGSQGASGNAGTTPILDEESTGSPDGVLKTQQSPPLWLSLLPILLPVMMLASWTIIDSMQHRLEPATREAFRLIGNKNLAMLVAGLISIALLWRQRGGDFRDLMPIVEPAIVQASTVILITAAGGAFGDMLSHAGLADAFLDWHAQGPALLALSWAISVIIKTAQGSGTAAMIVTSKIVDKLIKSMPQGSLPYHPIYLYLAIGFGSKMMTWMNDSGFWIVCKLGGFTEAQALKSWTLCCATMSICGLLEVLIASALVPLRSLPAAAV